MIGPDTGIALGVVLTIASGLAGLIGWAAILRYRQGEHAATIKALEVRMKTLEDWRLVRDSAEAERERLAATARVPSVPPAVG